MKYYIQILSTKSPDSSPAFIIHFDSQRYLFNCSEGTQRLINENKIHLGKIKNLFFTRSIWENIGGLPGMVLTLADSGTKEFGVHGPRNLLKCFVGSRNFLQRSQVNFKVHEFLSSDEKYVDENLSIIPVPIYPTKVSNDANISSPTIESPLDTDNIVDSISSFKRKISVIDNQYNSYHLNRKILKSMFSGKEVGTLKTSKIYKNDKIIPYTSLTEIQNDENCDGDNDDDDFNLDDYRDVRIKQPRTPDYSLCYICQSHKVPGKFNPKKAKELGVPPGKQFGLLAKGECVTTPDGNIVRPEQVKEPDKVSSIFIVVDCPSLDHIPSLISQNRLKNESVKQYTKNIIHILGDPEILRNDQYKAWMNEFSDNCNHIIACRDYCSNHINFLSNSYMQYKLNQVDTESFPLLYFNNEVKNTFSDDNQLPKNIISACNNLQIHIEPTEHLDYSKVKENFNLNNIPEKISEKLKNNADAIHTLKSSINQWRQEHPFLSYPSSTDLEIVTLGTGSALPSKYRNVSSTIILSKRNGHILLDAGEGTLGQICRHFGLNKTMKEILPEIRMIFVSHIHADHHLGLMNILSKMASLERTIDHPLYIIAPEKFNIWLEEYNNIQDIGLNRFIKVVPSYLLFRKYVNAYAKYDEMLDYLNMKNIETVPVMHVKGACAIVFDYKDCSLENDTTIKPIRLAYSGDCRPNREFIRAGMNADVLIHESTFESELEYEAIKKFHCTINEACTVGRCMRVKFLLLTHFSQRYPKVPLFPVFKSSDYNSNLLYSHIFDALPTTPYVHYGAKGNFNHSSDNTKVSTVSSTTTTASTTPSLSPSNSVSVLTPASSSQSLFLNDETKAKSCSCSPILTSQPRPLMLIPTEAGLSSFQLIPSIKGTISDIEKMLKSLPEDPNYKMKIGMAVDHFHLRVGYDENCMEWITEAMRILIPDDEEDEEEEISSSSSEKKKLEKSSRCKENYNKTCKGNSKRNESKKGKYLSAKRNSNSQSDSLKSVDATLVESESDTQNHERPTPADGPIHNKRIKF
ncbi:hypothetical protein BCR36DRAFT_341049 [Piromyces finnis]|uniref:ribonuclease Z n=1 Tax=Piromyces finnis TaxID=1754191 RepID=A0A1Y1VP98_9FUNG|nr:hypothetical protein BCR36DRAFT_341049 [Piromyces finnis]|eukprot:ORX60973.1 hypothetical protein BCR36DRAFT_341049 [Piromyces finnis]